MEAHRHIGAGAGNTVDVLIACQAEASQALLRVEQHHCPTAARQTIDLLIPTQLHMLDTPVLLSPVVMDERASAEMSRAELLLARQRDAGQLARATEPCLAPARDTRKIDILLEDDDARPAVRVLFADRVDIRRKRPQQAFRYSQRNTLGRVCDKLQLAFAADLVRGSGPQVHRLKTRELLPHHVDRHGGIMLRTREIRIGLWR